MLRRFVELKSVVRAFITQMTDNALVDKLEITKPSWDLIEVLIAVLSPFEECTKLLSESRGGLEQGWAIYNYLYSCLKAQRETLATMVNRDGRETAWGGELRNSIACGEDKVSTLTIRTLTI
jgi:hypothetical protein